MSGGGPPPHNPHNRHHVPPANAAWNHLPVPGFFPRQPQVAHMQAEHSLLHQPSWHTPTTTATADPMKLMPHTQMLSEMFKKEGLFPRDCVDLSLARNGNQNGELASTPALSLSVRDTSKINSMLDIQAMELTKCASPNLKSAAISPGAIRSTSSPGLKVAPGMLGSGPAMKSLSPGRKSLSPGPKSSSPGLNLGPSLLLPSFSATVSSAEMSKNQKRSNIRVDSILERLNPTPEKTFPYHETKHDPVPSTTVTPLLPLPEKSLPEKPLSQSQSVIVQAAATFDENSNSSGTTNVPTPKEEDSASMHSNEDSLDSTKSRRKRKPNKTVRVNKEDDVKGERDQRSPDTPPSDLPPTAAQNHHRDDPSVIATILEGAVSSPPPPSKMAEQPSTDDVDGAVLPLLAKTRRKTSSESETIDDIAAMVREGLKEKRERSAEEDGEKLERRSVERKLREERAVNMSEQDDTANDQEVSDRCEDQEKVAVEHKTPAINYKDIVEPTKEEDALQSEPAAVVDQLDQKNAEDTDEPMPTTTPDVDSTKPVTVSVIKTKEKLEDPLARLGIDIPPESPGPSSKVPPSATALPHTKGAPASTSGPHSAPPLTPAQKKASITHFVEVENKLEEMFAGIVEEDPVESQPSVPLKPLKNESILSLTDDSFMKSDESDTSPKEEAEGSQEMKNTHDSRTPPKKEEVKNEESEDKKPTPKKVRRNRPLSTSKRESDLEAEVPSKKKRLTKTKTNATSPKKPQVGLSPKSLKKVASPQSTLNRAPSKSLGSDVAKDVYAYDSGSNASSSKSRGPFVQIRGPRDSPVSVSVVNTPLAGDEDGERKSLKNRKFHDDSEYRHKVRSRGLHCSTLSTKYDAERKDATWICAFCKRGPHASELSGPSVINEVPPQGDLFGPYFITTQCPEFEKRLDDPYDRQFKSRKISKALDAAAAATKSSGKKTKRKSESSDPGDSYLGITETSNNRGTYEVWTHEDCMVWSPGVYLVGPKIAGLEEAVWTCSLMTCVGCGMRGANVTCVKRGCLNAAHVCCAHKQSWRMDGAAFKAFCPEHSR